MTHSALRWLLAALFLVLHTGEARGGQGPLEAGLTGPLREVKTLKLMTFNIRYGQARDGANAWENRKELVVETIQRCDPDLLGVQEALDFQVAFLEEKLPHYRWIGVGRDDGRNAGEFAPLFFKREHFASLSYGYFWLSDTPHVPGTKGWDAALPRMVTWAHLGLKTGGRLVTLDVFTTHFDHRGAQARVASARLLKQRIDRLGPNRFIAVLGDFNAPKNSLPYRALAATPGGPFPAAVLLDPYAALHPEEPPQGHGTFHGFSGTARPGRIDWILLSPALKTRKAEIVTHNRGGRFPSDHFPVVAVVTVSGGEAR